MENASGVQDPKSSEVPGKAIDIYEISDTPKIALVLQPEVFCNDTEASSAPFGFDVDAEEAAVNHEMTKITSKDDVSMTNPLSDNIIGKSTSPQKVKRRVYFPEDGKVVAGYRDPPKPWNDRMSSFYLQFYFYNGNGNAY